MDLPETIDAGELVLKRWQPAYTVAATKAVQESLPQLELFMPWAHQGYDETDSRSFIERSADEWAEGTAFYYAVFTAAGELVGSCGLMTRMGEDTLETRKTVDNLDHRLAPRLKLDSGVCGEARRTAWMRPRG